MTPPMSQKSVVISAKRSSPDLLLCYGLLFDEGEREMMHYFEGTRQRPRLETTKST